MEGELAVEIMLDAASGLTCRAEHPLPPRPKGRKTRGRMPRDVGEECTI